MKILVVEDELKTGNYLKQGLMEADFVVDLVSDGEDGLPPHKRIRFGCKSEALTAEQRDLFIETAEEDGAAIDAELAEQQAPTDAPRTHKRRGRNPLPPELPRIEHRHEPESCTCGACGRDLVKIGEDISEQLDVEPARFFVHRHIRPQYACRRCETITEAEIIDVIHRNVGATTVKGVKKRCRPGAGRCQGGFCSPRVVEILARELGCEMDDIMYDAKDKGYILNGKTKEI